MAEPAIVVHDLHKEFVLPQHKMTSLKQVFVNLGRKNSKKRQKVLDGINFTINKGEFVGIVGRNGSGKSTLLKILAGVYAPTVGSVTVHGSLTPFIELGVGFNPELSGRDNVFLNGALLGFSHKEMEAMYDDIVSFAELGDFMEQKLKNYSSGMQVRLAFSIAVRAKSDILLLDEVLAVGDAAFQQKCFNYFEELKAAKQTVVFVSHDMGAIKDFCDRALLIQNGEVTAIGSPDRIANKYNLLNFAINEDAAYSLDTSDRWGTGDAAVTGVQTLRGPDRAKTFFPGEEMTIQVEAEFRNDIEQPVVGLVIKSAEGLRVMATNTRYKQVATKTFKGGEKAVLEARIKNIFADGRYTISPFVSDMTGKLYYDWIEGAAWFDVAENKATDGVVMPDHKLSLRKV